MNNFDNDTDKVMLDCVHDPVEQNLPQNDATPTAGAPAAASHEHGGFHHDDTPLVHRYLYYRNIAVFVAAILFTMSLIPIVQDWYIGLPLKSVAYFVGATAYWFEYMILTGGLKHKPPRNHMFMPNVFGIMYIILGISYILH